MIIIQSVIRHRRPLVIMTQAALVTASYLISFLLRFDGDPNQVPWHVIATTLPHVVLARVVVLALFRLHRGLWSYVSVVDLLQLIRATTVSTLAIGFALIMLDQREDFPRSILLLDWAGNIFLLGGIRLAMRMLRERTSRVRVNTAKQHVLIVGAGEAGATLCRQLLADPRSRYVPVAFVDDDRQKVGGSIMGVPIMGNSGDIPRIAADSAIRRIIIAVPSGTPDEIREIVDQCQASGVPFKTLPSVSGMIDDTVSLSLLRDIEVADLLGRPMAHLDLAATRTYIHGRRILVTGAGGSVGSELVRQLAPMQPERLVLIDRAENSLFLLDQEIRHSFPDLNLTARIVDVSRRPEMERLMSEHRPHLVFHAAAHKHVPLMEDAPIEAIQNNIGGTLVAAECAIDAGVERFVLISTDKAVNPSSVMGRTKRVAELLVRELDARADTRFLTVRFGNVLGSSGSVVPIFEQQIASGGPVTVTHAEATRYFMSVAEAAALILQAAAVGQGGEVFLLDMGEPISIVTLAETLIRLSGFEPYDDLEIEFTGLRPGEKLTEDLTYPDEEFVASGYDKLLLLKDGGEPAKIGADVVALLEQCPDLPHDQAIDRLVELSDRQD